MRIDNLRATAGDQRGSALLATLLVMLCVGVIGMSLSVTSSTDVLVASNYRENQRAFYAADGGAHAAFEAIIRQAELTGLPPDANELASLTPPALSGASYDTMQISITGADQTAALPSGPFQGLTALTRPYEATVTAVTTGAPVGRATVRMSALIDLIPVFQFALFAEDDLQFNPGKPMTVTGRVHTNSDAYFNSWSGRDPLQFNDVVTVAGEVYAQDPWQGNGRGQKLFPNASGGHVDLGNLTSAHPDWHDLALTNWDGNLRSGAHGVETVSLPLPAGTSPRTIIDPPAASDDATLQRSKLYYKSDVRILNGVARNSAGQTLSVIDPVSGDPAIRPTVIRDERELHDMLVLEIDVEKLSRTQAWPANGSVYLALGEPVGTMTNWATPVWNAATNSWDTESWPTDWAAHNAPYNGGNTDFAIKLVNGDQLPGPLTVASDNPVYVKGPFNSVAKQPAAVISDAVTILSPSWGRKNSSGSIPSGDPDDDLGYSSLSMSTRDASSATYNFSMMTGVIPAMQAPRGNGGPENIMRMLEDWRYRTVTWRGSAVTMWGSQYADSGFTCCTWYTIPTRDFSFDTDLLDISKLPPNTPSLFQVRVSDWSQE
jgi:Tfp pilus assembly protein PilX